MNKMKIVGLGTMSILLLLSMLLFFYGSQSSGSESPTMVEKAVNFLVSTQFNKSLGLCREAPEEAKDTYWLVSDNLWAWKALNMAGESGLSNAHIANTTAEEIRTTLTELAAKYGLQNDSSDLPKSNAHEAVIGDAVLLPFNETTDCTLYANGYILNTTMYNGTTPMLDWANYTDLLLYAALSYHWQRNDSEALNCYQNATKMWNETSKGLQDAAFNRTYDTYKLALLLYTSKVLDQSLTFESELVDRIYAQQRESDGGIVTDYFANGTLEGDANTETTSIVIIALLTPPIEPGRKLPTFAFYYPWYGNSTNNWHNWNSAGHNPENNIVDRRSDIAATDYPLLGAYDSNDENVTAQHIDWAKNCGIDCFIISWWGINSYTDNASKHIKNVCERKDFKFTFYVENTSENYHNPPSIDQTVNDITYLLNTYGNSSSFYKIDGAPVIFVYAEARDSLNSHAWVWHACTDDIGIDSDPNTNKSASTQWLPTEEVRKPPRLGIVPFQPFATTPGYVQNISPIHLQPDTEYWLNASVSDIRNDSSTWSDVGIKIKMGLDPTCNETLYDQIVNFTDGWIDLSLPINMTRYAGQDVYIGAESHNGGLVNWSSEWAAIDYFYITDASGKIVSSDPFFDNGWNETIYEIRAKGYTPYVIMDFGGYKDKLQGFIDYFSDSIDGIHVYSPLDISDNPLEVYDLYHEARELAHSYDKTFIATVIPGFNNIAISNRSQTLIVDRRNGACYSTFWQIARACNPDGYAITSFNEWHEGTEIEPSVDYGNQYLNLTRDNTIPELSIILLFPFMIVMLLAVIVCRRKHERPFRMRYS